MAGFCGERCKWVFEKLKQDAEKRNRNGAERIFSWENTKLYRENTK
jgi:hypothetical protein